MSYNLQDFKIWLSQNPQQKKDLQENTLKELENKGSWIGALKGQPSFCWGNGQTDIVLEWKAEVDKRLGISNNLADPQIKNFLQWVKLNKKSYYDVFLHENYEGETTTLGMWMYRHQTSFDNLRDFEWLKNPARNLSGVSFGDDEYSLKNRVEKKAWELIEIFKDYQREQKLTIELEQIKKEKVELETKITQLQQELDTLKSQLTQKNQQIQELQTKITALTQKETELTNTRNSIQELTTANDTLQQKLADTQQASTARETKLFQAEEAIEELQDQLNKEQEQFTQQLATQQKLIQELEQSLTNKDSECQKLLQEKETAKNVYQQKDQDLKNKIHECEELHQQLTTKINELSEEYRLSQENLTTKEQQLANQQTEYENFKRQAFEAQSAAVLATSLALNTELEELKKQGVQQDQEITELMTKLVREEANSLRLTQELDALKKELTDKNRETQNTEQLINEEALQQQEFFRQQVQAIKTALGGKISPLELKEFQECQALLSSIFSEWTFLSKENLRAWIQTQINNLQQLKELQSKLGSLADSRISELLSKEQQLRTWQIDLGLNTPKNLLIDSNKLKKQLALLKKDKERVEQELKVKESEVKNLQVQLDKSKEVKIPESKSWWSWWYLLILIPVLLVLWIIKKLKIIFVK